MVREEEIMLICDKCGKTIAYVQPVIHYSTCSVCWQKKRETQNKKTIKKASSKNDDARA